MYCVFPSGATCPHGYVAPCRVLKEIPGHAQVLLSAAPPYERHNWVQWVRKSQLVAEDDLA